MGNLELVVWEITDRCNLNCLHCYKKHIETNKFTYASDETIPLVCSSLRRLKTKTLVISGGEPLLELDNVFSILNELSNDDISITLTTNGTLLSESVVKKLKENRLSTLQISIDGISRDKHERIRGLKTYDKTIQAIQMCVDANLPIVLMTVPNRDTIDDLIDVAILAANLGVTKLGIERPFPCSNKYNKSFCFSSTELKRFHDTIMRIEMDNIIPVHCNDPIYNIRKLVDRNIPASILLNIPEYQQIGCSAGRSSLVISSNGKIRPCTFINTVVGDLCEASLELIWEKSPQLSVIRNRVSTKGRCSFCSYYPLCRGCVAQVLVSNNSFDGSDDSCYL